MGFGMLLSAPTAQAAIITNQVGTVAPDGATVAERLVTLSGGFISSDLSWTHTYGAITDTILSATIQIDLIDTDANGFLRLYAGTDTSGVVIGDTTNGASQGTPGPWRDLDPASPPNPCSSTSGSCDSTITISAALFADLADGTFDVFGEDNGLGIYGSNRALLTIVTEDTNGGGGGDVPEPATLGLLGLAVAGLGIGTARRRRRR